MNNFNFGTADKFSLISVLSMHVCFLVFSKHAKEHVKATKLFMVQWHNEQYQYYGAPAGFVKRTE